MRSARRWMQSTDCPHVPVGKCLWVGTVGFSEFGVLCLLLLRLLLHTEMDVTKAEMQKKGGESHRSQSTKIAYVAFFAKPVKYTIDNYYCWEANTRKIGLLNQRNEGKKREKAQGGGGTGESKRVTVIVTMTKNSSADSVHINEGNNH